jgi:hypothetical protein
MPDAGTPLEGTWTDERADRGRDQLNRVGTKTLIGEPQWRGEWTVVWDGISYQTAARILYEAAGTDIGGAGLGDTEFLWTPRSNIQGDPITVDVDDDGVAEYVLSEIEIPCLLTEQPSTTPLNRRVDGEPVCRLELQFESSKTYPERAGFAYPETMNFGVSADAGDNLDLSFLDESGAHSTNVGQVVIADSNGQTVDVVSYPGGMPYNFPSAEGFSVSVVSGSSFSDIHEVRLYGPINGATLSTEDLTNLVRIDLGNPSKNEQLAAGPLQGDFFDHGTEIILRNDTAYDVDLADFPDRYTYIQVNGGSNFGGDINDMPTYLEHGGLRSTQITGAEMQSEIPDGLRHFQSPSGVTHDPQAVAKGASDKLVEHYNTFGQSFVSPHAWEVVFTEQPNLKIVRAVGNNTPSGSPKGDLSASGLIQSNLQSANFRSNDFDSPFADFSSADSLNFVRLDRDIQAGVKPWPTGVMDALVDALNADVGEPPPGFFIDITERGSRDDYDGGSDRSAANSLSTPQLKKVVGIDPTTSHAPFTPFILQRLGFIHGAVWAYGVASVNTGANEIYLPSDANTSTSPSPGGGTFTSDDGDETSILTWYPDGGTWAIREKDRLRSGEYIHLTGGADSGAYQIQSATYDGTNTIITVGGISGTDVSVVWGYTPVTKYA